MRYQEISVADGSSIGQPGHLPAQLVGLSDASLANLAAALNPTPAQFVGRGFLPVADPVPPTPPVVLSSYDFLLLFTTAERVAILTAAQSNMQMADWMNMLNHVSFVHLDHAKTIAGVDALEAAGLIASGRAAQVLANQAP